MKYWMLIVDLQSFPLFQKPADARSLLKIYFWGDQLMTFRLTIA